MVPKLNAMRKWALVNAIGFLICCAMSSFAQQVKFNNVESKRSDWGLVYSVEQDQQGYLWMGTLFGGIKRYDGNEYISYMNDPKNQCILRNIFIKLNVDSDGIVWASALVHGLDRLDPVTGNFTHFRHQSNDSLSILNDTVTSIVADHLGNIWVGTLGGLDLLNQQTGKFTHYKNDPRDD